MFLNSAIKYLLQISLIFTLAYTATAQVSEEQDQPLDIAGLWKGTVTQNEGGYKTLYDLEMYFYQKGDSISGRSYVAIDEDSIFVDMEISGTIHSDILLRMVDVRKIAFKVKEGMEWCDKRYQLVIKRDKNDLTIEGYWQGETSFSNCIPGRIFLRRFQPRA